MSSSELYADAELKELKIMHNGKEYVFGYRELSWATRNKILSDSLTVDEQNRGHLNLDKYKRGCLLKMIKEHPFPDPLEVALIKVNDEVGRQLEAIVPSNLAVIPQEEEDFCGEPSEAP